MVSKMARFFFKTKAFWYPFSLVPVLGVSLAAPKEYQNGQFSKTVSFLNLEKMVFGTRLFWYLFGCFSQEGAGKIGRPKGGRVKGG